MLEFPVRLFKRIVWAARSQPPATNSLCVFRVFAVSSLVGGCQRRVLCIEFSKVHWANYFLNRPNACNQERLREKDYIDDGRKPCQKKQAHEPPRGGSRGIGLVLSMLTGLLMGIIVFGQVLMVQNVLVNVAREGARARYCRGAPTPRWPTIIENYMSKALNITAAPGLAGGWNYTVSPSLPQTAGTNITVTVTMPCSKVTSMDVFAPFFNLAAPPSPPRLSWYTNDMLF